MDNPMNEVADRVGENFDEVRARLSERTRQLQSTVQQFVDDNPLGAVGIAFGIGYLLSGALFSRATFKAASVGGRLVVGGFLRQLVAGIGPGLIGAILGAQAQAQQQEAPEEASAQRRDGGNRPST
jgi:hypothetical protein